MHVQVTFTKAASAKHFPVWVARRGKAVIRGSHLGSDPRHLPHDIVTFVVEKELHIDDGFFATVAAGGTFRSMAKRRHADGRAAIARNRAGLDRAEHVVHGAWDAWLAGRATPCAAALDRAYAEWQATPPGGAVTLEWPTTAARPAKRRRPRR